MSPLRSAVFRPLTLGEAVHALATTPGAVPLAGGTDLVPAMRDGSRQPRAIVTLRRVVELNVRGECDATLTVGAGVTYQRLAGWGFAAGLARTAQVVGSPHIRNTGTVGGALGTASPTGDLVTFLVAADAQVLLAGPGGRRRLPVAAYLADRADSLLSADSGTVEFGTDERRAELVTAVQLPRPSGPQTYLKVGGRQAAYAAVVSCALLVDRPRHRVSCAFGGLTAVPRAVAEAQRFAAVEIDWSSPDTTMPVAEAEAVARKFGPVVAEAAAASTDLLPDGPRLATSYRVHAAGVLACRALARCLVEREPPATERPPAGRPPAQGEARP